MSRHLAIAVAALQLSVSTARADIVNTPQLRRLVWQMLEDAGMGARGTEVSAFIVVRDGALTLIRWPESDAPYSARWFGPFPNGAIAIVHTHPNWNPLPSKIDMRTARQTHLPVYVVTRMAISKTIGGEPQIILSRDWPLAESGR